VRFYFTGTEFLYDYNANLSKAVGAKRLPVACVNHLNLYHKHYYLFLGTHQMKCSYIIVHIVGLLLKFVTLLRNKPMNNSIYIEAHILFVHLSNLVFSDMLTSRYLYIALHHYNIYLYYI